MDLVPYPKGTGNAQAIPSRYDPGTKYSLSEAGELGTGAAKKELARPKREAAIAGTEAKTNFVSDTIDAAKDSADVWTSGFIGSTTSWVPGTPAHDLGNTLSTVKANIGFDKLREMRESSPTGGALGQVSDRENTLLQQVWSSVEQSQSPKQLRDNLDRVKRQIHESWARVRAAYKNDYGIEYGGGDVPEDVPAVRRYNPATGKIE